MHWGRLSLIAWAVIPSVVGGLVMADDVSTGTVEVVDNVLTNDDHEAYAGIELLTEVMVHVRRHYVEEKAYEEILYGALHGMLNDLDPHSGFLEPEALDNMQEETEGKYGGIGVHIGLREGQLTVIAPIEDTPGFRAGLQAGDRVVAVDGQKTTGINLREAVKRMRGAQGESVVLTIYRQGEGAPFDVDIVREEIKVPSVKAARMLSDGVGYVRITQFSAPTGALLQEALEQLGTNGMDALVLDLRNNPGGLLKSAIEVAQLFLAQETLIVSTRDRGTGQSVENVARAKRPLLDIPIAVLINAGSASASEIVAGALKDHRRAVLVGETSFGKGSVQSIIRLRADPEAAIRLTTAHYYTPAGRMIHGKGIDPDVPVYVPPSEWARVLVRRSHVEYPDAVTEELRREYQDAEDRQLNRAEDLLKAIMILDR